MVTVLYSISTMSGLAVVMVRSVGTVDTEPSQALWLGRSANTFAAGLDSLMKCANLDSTRSWRQVYLPSCNAVGKPHIIIIIITNFLHYKILNNTEVKIS